MHLSGDSVCSDDLLMWFWLNHCGHAHRNSNASQPWRWLLLSPNYMISASLLQMSFWKYGIFKRSVRPEWHASKVRRKTLTLTLVTIGQVGVVHQSNFHVTVVRHDGACCESITTDKGHSTRAYEENQPITFSHVISESYVLLERCVSPHLSAIGRKSQYPAQRAK